MSSAEGKPTLPRPDLPSAEVLDELLAAFSVDVSDQARLEQVDLDSPEVDELLAGPASRVVDPEARGEVESRAAPQVEAEGSSAPAGAPTPPTIVISVEHERPDAVYLGAGDPLLAGRPFAGPDVETSGGRVEDGPVFIDDALTAGDATVISLEDATSATHIEPRLRDRRIAVKRAAGRKRLKWFVIVVVAVGLVVAGLAVLGSSLFAIEDVDVEGAVYADPAAVAAVVDELRGTPVLRADTDAAVRALEAIPWVEDARVTTDFPRGVTIELRERRPVASFQAGDGSFRVIDDDGRVLDVLASQPIDYVLVSAADAPALAAGEFAPVGFRAAASLAQALTAEMRAAVTTVTTTADGSDVRLSMTDGTEVRFGAGRDLVAKLVRLQTWLDTTDDGAVQWVDVSTDEVTVAQ